ncbi:thioredoxin-dependent thiol peroxidase [Nocardiopsis trehalosi]|uniref:thioredoxin-dependent thiol peroxidase n=1 Tax=Nocardiopsis trehalosi TaxID=109329 RepID=UPI00082AD851|nr:thioredoxin-dependent thiol peroxidase [Nocardiopsis trehalosi]
MTASTVRLQPGDTAPDFTLPDADGTPVTLSEVLKSGGGRVVLYFYPAAMTPGCTTEACDFRDNLRQFQAAGFTVLGVSPDTPERLAEFRDQEGLTFPLLGDPDREVLRAYGAFGEKKNYGKVVQGVIRSTFAIAADGTVEKAFYNVKATGHVGRLRRELGA